MTRKPDTTSFWTGRLPHWEVAEGRYFITIHLAGAIPQIGKDRIHQLSAQHQMIADKNTEEWIRLQRSVYKEMESSLDRTDYVSFLQRYEIANMILESIEFRQGRDWNMIEYVIMPSHIHLFCEILGPSLKHVLEQFKRWTGHKGLELLRDKRNRFWQDEWFDHWSRSGEEDDKIIQYIRQNPVKAKLVDDYRKWPYGSWRQK